MHIRESDSGGTASLPRPAMAMPCHAWCMCSASTPCLRCCCANKTGVVEPFVAPAQQPPGTPGDPSTALPSSLQHSQLYIQAAGLPNAARTKRTGLCTARTAAALAWLRLAGAHLCSTHISAAHSPINILVICAAGSRPFLGASTFSATTCSSGKAAALADVRKQRKAPVRRQRKERTLRALLRGPQSTLAAAPTGPPAVAPSLPPSLGSQPPPAPTHTHTHTSGKGQPHTRCARAPRLHTHSSHTPHLALPLGFVDRGERALA